MLVGRTVALRPFDRRHADQTRVWANDSELARLLDRAHPVSDIEHERWLAALHDQPSRLYLAIETLTDQQYIGNAWLWDIDCRHRKAELRIVIGNRDYLSKGMGSEAIELLCSFAFTRLNLHKIYAFVLANNQAALRSFAKVKFELEGILKQDRWSDDRYVDVHLLARLR